MWGLIAEVGIEVGIYALNQWLTKTPPVPDPGQSSDLRYPRAEEGAQIPLFYGRIKVASPNIIWLGTLDNYDNGDGTKDFLAAMQMCIGIPGGRNATAVALWEGDQKHVGFTFGGHVYQNFTGGSNSDALIDTTSAFIKSPLVYDRNSEMQIGFWGGDLTPSGGFSDSNWATVFNNDPSGEFDETVLPQYRGYCTAAFYWPLPPSGLSRTYRDWSGYYVGSGRQATDVQLRQFAFEVQADATDAIDPTHSLGTSLGAIGNGDANPANVLWDLLTNAWGRGGLDPSLLDQQSFYNCGVVLAAENLGISFVIYDRTDMGTVVNNILNTIDGCLFEDPTDGKLHLKLIRNDYNPATIPVFDPSNIIRIEDDDETDWDLTINKMIVSYTSREANYTTRTAPQDDQGNFYAVGEIRPLDNSYPYITEASTAFSVAARDLKVLSRPLRIVKVRVNRDAWLLHLVKRGDAIKVNYPLYNISGLILRVARVDLGTLEDGSILLNCTEDIYADAVSTIAPPPQIQKVRAMPDPIVTRTVDEAPRWLQYHANQLGVIGSVDAQHAWFLDTPLELSPLYKPASMTPQVSRDAGATFLDDSQPQNPFPTRAILNLSYSRALDPYDTATGIQIQAPSDTSGLYNVSTINQIANDGINLVRIDSEILAFESFTDNGDGTFQLNNVWRGLLDTAPADHAGGATLYFLARVPYGVNPPRLSNSIFSVGDAPVIRLMPKNSLGDGLSPATDQPSDALTIRGRTLLPYPVADLKIGAHNGSTSKAPAALTVDGIDLAWRTRDRLKTIITRGDAAAETMESGSTIDLRARKTGLAPLSEVNVVTGLSAATVSYAGMPLGRAGHGTIYVAPRSQNANGRTWQDPSLTISAPHWRNLLPNGDFSDAAMTGWTTVTGTPSVLTSGAPDTNGHYVANGSPSVGLEIAHTIDIAGYQADGMAVFLEWYDKNTTPGNTTTLTIIAQDISGSHLGSDATSTVTPSTTTWTRHELSYTALPTGTTQIKIDAVLAPGAEMTNIRVRVGQLSSQIVLNNDFEAGALTSWTQFSGSWAVSSTTPYAGGWCAKSTATGSLRQAPALPSGYEYGTVVVSCARGEVDGTTTTHDSGTLTVLALDAGSATLTSVTTGSETIGSGNAKAWAPRLLTLALPAGTAFIGVQFDSGAHTANAWCAAIDDVTVRIYKHLDPDASIDLRLDTPVTQAMPSDRAQWIIPYPLVQVPDVMFDFTSARPTLGGVDMAAGADVILGGKFVGSWNGVSSSTVSCAEFTSAAASEDINSMSNTTFANFDGSTSFTVSATVRFDGESNIGAARGICGRMDVTGWSLEIGTDGKARAHLEGAGSQTVSGGIVLTDGAPHRVTMVYNAGTSTVHIIDEDGTDRSASTASVGNFSQAGIAFRIGRRGTSQTAMRGQIARLYMWTSTAMAAADIGSTWTLGKDPSGTAISTYTRTGAWALAAHPDTDGVLIARHSTTQVGLAYDTAMASDGTGWGLASQASITNLVPTIDMENTTYWKQGAGAQVTIRQQGPEGYYNAAKIHHTGGGVSTDYLELQGSTLGAGNPTAIWYYRNPSGVNSTIKVELADSTGAVIDTFSFSAGSSTLWQRKTHTFTWTNPTATGRFRFYSTSGGTTQDILVSPIIFVAQLGAGGILPIGIPTGANNGATASAAASTTSNQSFTAQMNSEGEVYVEPLLTTAAGGGVGTFANIHNVSNSNDRRRLYTGSASNANFDHYDGAGSSSTQSLAVADYAAAVAPQRGRWCRIGTLPTTARTAEIRNGAGSASVRGATWTPSTTATSRLDIGHSNGSDVLTGVIRRVKVTSREQNVTAYTAT